MIIIIRPLCKQLVKLCCCCCITHNFIVFHKRLIGIYELSSNISMCFLFESFNLVYIIVVSVYRNLNYAIIGGQ